MDYIPEYICGEPQEIRADMRQRGYLPRYVSSWGGVEYTYYSRGDSVLKVGMEGGRLCIHNLTSQEWDERLQKWMENRRR